MNRAPAVAELSAAVKRYGERTALAGVDLRLEAGSIYALVGANGAGKSTLVSALCGAFALDSGEARIGGQDPRRSPDARRRIGLAPQEIALYPHLSVRENLEVFAALSGLSRGERQAAVETALERTHAAPRADSRIEHLSGGWRRRANIAAAIIHDPDLLILDEPTVGVDAEAREGVGRVIRDLRDQGAAILLISHDADQVAALADRIGVLHQGALVLEGAPRELLAAAFGEREEIAVSFTARPEGQALSHLTEAGLCAGADPTCWRGVVEGAAAKARALHDALKAVDAPLREIGVRAPGIDALAARTLKALEGAAS